MTFFLAVVPLQAQLQAQDPYLLLVDFQSAIVGMVGFFFGFGGVILTLRSNARLAREQNEEHAKTSLEQFERDLELRRRVVRSGVLAELRRSRTTLNLNIYTLREADPAGSTYPQLLPELVVSHRLVHDVGVLNDKEIDGVVIAMASIDSLRDTLVSNDLSKTSDKSVSVSRRRVEIVEGLTNATIRTLDEAIAILDGSSLEGFQ
ncbi:MAG: hypothetical protein AAGM21_01765 [Pseudomonadota bacterium]